MVPPGTVRFLVWLSSLRQMTGPQVAGEGQLCSQLQPGLNEDEGMLKKTFPFTSSYSLRSPCPPPPKRKRKKKKPHKLSISFQEVRQWKKHNKHQFQKKIRHWRKYKTIKTCHIPPLKLVFTKLKHKIPDYLPIQLHCRRLGNESRACAYVRGPVMKMQLQSALSTVGNQRLLSTTGKPTSRNIITSC